MTVVLSFVIRQILTLVLPKCCWRSSKPRPESFELSQTSCVAPLLGPWSSELLTVTSLKVDRDVLDCCCCCGCCCCCCRCWWWPTTRLVAEWARLLALLLETDGAVTVDDVPPALLPAIQRCTIRLLHRDRFVLSSFAVPGHERSLISRRERRQVG